MPKSTTTSKKKPSKPSGKKKSTTRSTTRGKPVAKAPTKAKVKSDFKNEIVGLILGAIGVFFMFCIFATDKAGLLGSIISDILFGCFGMFAYVVPIVIVIFGIISIFSLVKKIRNSSIILWTIFTLSILMLVHTITLKDMAYTGFMNYVLSSYSVGIDGAFFLKGSGAISSLLVYPLRELLGFATTIVFFITLLIIVVVIETRLSIARTGKIMHSKIKEKVKVEREYRSKLFIDDISETGNENKRNKKSKKEKKDIKEKEVTLLGGEDFYHNKENNMPEFLQQYNDNKHSKEAKPSIIQKDEPQEPVIVMEEMNKPKPKPKVKTPVIKIEDIADENDDEPKYVYPPIDLLRKSNNPKTKNVDKFMAEADKLERTLKSFGVEAKVIQISRGPAITRYELQPAPGVKSKSIVNLSNDIALNLAATAVRIVAPIPGKAAIGVEVPNKVVSMVTLRDIIESSEFENSEAD